MIKNKPCSRGIFGRVEVACVSRQKLAQFDRLTTYWADFQESSFHGSLYVSPFTTRVSETEGDVSRDRFEVGMESRDAHANLSRDGFDAQWLGEILTQLLDGSDYAMSVSPTQYSQ